MPWPYEVEANGGGDAVEGNHRQNRADGGLPELWKEPTPELMPIAEREERQAQSAQLGVTRSSMPQDCPHCQRDGQRENGGGAEANALDFHMAERHCLYR